MQTAYITHPACRGHDMGAGHPEQPARLAAIEDRLRASGRYDLLAHHEAPRATLEQLARVHDAAYIDALRAAAPSQGLVAIDPDTRMGPGTWEAALRAAGAAVLATDLTIAGETPRQATHWPVCISIAPITNGSRTCCVSSRLATVTTA